MSFEVEDELVLGVARSAMRGGAGWQGVRGGAIDDLLEVIADAGSFRPRRAVERDPSWKQVIPYVVLRDGERVFLMRRTTSGGDPRLHERFSIGIGGHVNPDDGDVMGGMRREWREEIDASFEPAFEPVGLLNDESDEVSAVHVGLVFCVDAGGRPVAVREHDKLEGSFATLEEARAAYPRMERWSQHVLDHLERDGA